MAFFQVLQIDSNLRLRLDNTISRLGRCPTVAAAAARQLLAADVYRRKWIIRVDETCADPLGAVFTIANGMDHDEARLRWKLPGASSASVGDLIQQGHDGIPQLIRPIGFLAIPPLPSLNQAA